MGSLEIFHAIPRVGVLLRSPCSDVPISGGPVGRPIIGRGNQDSYLPWKIGKISVPDFLFVSKLALQSKLGTKEKLPHKGGQNTPEI